MVAPLPYLRDYSHKAPTTMGCYAATKFDKVTLKKLLFWTQQYYIKNATLVPDFHSTVVYSTKPLPAWVSPGPINPPISVDPKTYKFQVWETGTEQKPKNTLVLTFKCPYQTKRWHLAMAMGATWSYEKYIPHITLSSDVGPDFELETIKLPDFPLVIVSEYCEPLDNAFGTPPEKFDDEVKSADTDLEYDNNADAMSAYGDKIKQWTRNELARIERIIEQQRGDPDYGKKWDHFLRYILNG